MSISRSRKPWFFLATAALALTSDNAGALQDKTPRVTPEKTSQATPKDVHSRHEPPSGTGPARLS
jgi:hypothetical protein